LDQQFAGVRDVNLADGLRTLTHCAFELLFSEVGLTDEATSLTNVHLVSIRNIKEAFF
jgi:hypothetical protein